MNRIASLIALYWIDNFKLCNKYFYIIAKKFDFDIKNILIEIIELQLKEI